MSAFTQVVSNNFPGLATALPGVRDRALRIGAVTLVATADPLTPVDTGLLRANKTISVTSHEASVTWHQEYAGYVHEGTYKMPARPFARAALPTATAAVQAELGRFGS